MNRYMNDRARVELAMPLVAMDQCLVRGVRVKRGSTTYNRIVNAMNKALDDVYGSRPWNPKIVRRTRSAYLDMMEPYRDLDTNPMIFGLALYWMVWALTEQDYMRVGDDDAYRSALMLFFNVVEPDEAEEHKHHALARAGAKEILTLAQARGLYRGVDLTALDPENAPA